MKNWSRMQKLMLCVLILLISLFFIGSISNWPSPTPEIALRRQETQQLIGPAEIITTLEYENADGYHILLGKSDQGYTTFEYFDSVPLDESNLHYFPKAQDATLFCTEYVHTDQAGLRQLPIYLFPENRAAVAAKMTLTISTAEASGTYHLDGQRPDSSFYLFSLPVDDLEAEFFWLLQQALTGAYSEYVLTGTVEIEIEFFDASGNLIDTYSETVTK